MQVEIKVEKGWSDDGLDHWASIDTDSEGWSIEENRLYRNDDDDGWESKEEIFLVSEDHRILIGHTTNQKTHSNGKWVEQFVYSPKKVPAGIKIIKN